ncbi:1900_t:CDS:2, partial [Racocetra fulgida]
REYKALFQLHAVLNSLKFYNHELSYKERVAHQIIDSIEAFDHITYSTHVITINNESKSNNVDGMKLGNRAEVWNNISENISVFSTIFQGPSDIAITEAERLFSLLKNQKDKIDNILDSHAVYAVDAEVKFEDKNIIRTEDKKKSQSFNITIELWVNVKLNSKNSTNSTLEFEIDLYNCSVTKLLSEQCPSLDNLFCYYIDSLEIRASPLKSDDACIIVQKKKHSPHKSNNDITSTKVYENDYRFQMDVGAPQSIKAIFATGKKKGRSSTATTKEWSMRATFSGNIGNEWSYRFTDNDIGDNLD